MENNNPAEMSNEDLEKDQQQFDQNQQSGNQEHVKKSSATEGSLLTPENDPSSIDKIHAVTQPNTEIATEEYAQSAEDEDSQDGSMPDPEELDQWETNDDNPDKISG